MEKKSTDKNSSDKPQHERQSNERQTTERPSNERQSNERPSNDRQSNERSSNDRQSNDRQSNERPSKDRQSNEQTSNERQSSEKPSNERTSKDKSSTEKMLNEARSTDKTSSDTTQKGNVISKDELKGKITESESFQLINVLDPEFYNLGMIKGSMQIPFDELEERISELDKSEEVVTYCASTTCDKSRKAAELLAKKGFKVRAYEGGIKEWTQAKLPVDPQPQTTPA